VITAEALGLETRLLLLFLVGLVYGSTVNWAVYSLAFRTRPISPWSAPAPEAPRRKWYDRLPAVGWLWLRRERHVHGTGFWIRPLVVELCCGVGLAALYWWEVDQQGLWPPGFRAENPQVAHFRYFAHIALAWFMLVGSLIDIDEKTLPDAVTLPGTWLGLLLAALVPWTLLPVCTSGQPVFRLAVLGGDLAHATAVDEWAFLHLASPNRWPQALDGFPNLPGLLVALGCWWFWCFALMDRRWYGRVGFRRAAKYFVAGLLRRRSTGWICLMGIVGSLLITVIWGWSGDHWQGLLSAIIGMIVSGCVVWAIRLIGTWALQREAMGFGDVTLRGMIGCYLGWQPCVVVFFLAAMIALVGGLVSLIVHRQSEIPYGPFLCLAAGIVVVGWSWLWPQAEPVFALGWILSVALVICLALMPVLLILLRALRGLIGI